MIYLINKKDNYDLKLIMNDVNSNLENVEKKSQSFWTKKNIIWGIIFVVILLLIIVFTSIYLFNIDFSQIVQLVNNNSLAGKEGFLIGLILAYIYQWFWNSFCIFYSARKHYVKAKWYEWIIFGATIIFINGITPFSLGSEPYKVYWLSRHGLTSKESLLIVSSISIYWTITQIVLTWPSFIIISTRYNEIISQPQGTLAYWFSFGGMILDIIVFSSLVTVSISSKFHLFLANQYNKILHKFKLPYSSKEELISEFREKAIFKKAYIAELKRWDCVLIQLIGTSCMALMQYFSVYFAIQLLNVKGISQLSVEDIFNVSNVAISGNNFIPIPGAEGSIQIILSIFIQAFAGPTIVIDQTTKEQLNQAIFVWRSFLFYLPVITGLLFLGYVLWYHIHDEKHGNWKKIKKSRF
ncbi:lysylphosphatidylglycerol synthase transmembrane domain-containing protein [Mycoplasmoides pirum]|uniref:lysylphosphatidylglycerol synthase transmembrane domain-containing protein n=1 Tax=Mycoplasmoides pirum TaxID=2122 RepID=UPI0004837179|nr:YbhN family protein [Mycoplasmoides pirum]